MAETPPRPAIRPVRRRTLGWAETVVTKASALRLESHVHKEIAELYHLNLTPRVAR